MRDDMYVTSCDTMRLGVPRHYLGTVCGIERLYVREIVCDSVQHGEDMRAVCVTWEDDV